MRDPAKYAMSTIPTTFNSQNAYSAQPKGRRNNEVQFPSTWKGILPSYTAVGGSERAGTTGLSAVLLNREGRFPRRTLFEELKKAGFDYILSIESSQERYDVEELSGQFPFVRFILLQEKITPGESINLAAAELTGSYFFVLWNDYRLFNGINASKMVELFGGRRLCTVPTVQNSRFEVLHTIASPVYYKNPRGSTIKTIPEAPVRENQSTLYPHDWLGFYDKERFLRLGGFDREIIHPHWQLMDFGFRSYLWDEELRSTQIIRLVHDSAMPPEDSTTEESYRLFYLKNLAPEWRSDHAYLPWRCFLSFLATSGWDLPSAWNEFSRERKWVLANRNRFRRDARTFTEMWEHSRPERIESNHTEINYNEQEAPSGVVE